MRHGAVDVCHRELHLGYHRKIVVIRWKIALETKSVILPRSYCYGDANSSYGDIAVTGHHVYSSTAVAVR